MNKPTVLLVEDDYTSRKITKIFLKEICNVETAMNGIEAIEMCINNFYPLILMDIELSDNMDGVQTTSEIRRIPGYENIPIAALTAFGFRGDREKLLSAGLSDYLSKPVDRETLTLWVKKLLKGNI